MSGGFRLVSSLDAVEDRRAVATWTPEDDRAPPVLVLEALTQCAGLLLQHTDRDPAAHWLLAGVDDAELPQAAPSGAIRLECVVDRRSGTGASLIATARSRGAVVCRGRLLLVQQRLSSNA